jgi:hypothetical protein
VRAIAVSAAIAALLVPDSGAAGSDRSLLERHRPALVYDRAERWRAVAVDAFLADDLPPRLSDAPTPSDTPDVAYGRVARTGGRRWLQYWFFFAYNGQDRGIARTGRHEGDWEMFQVSLSRNGAPEAATFTQHSSAASCGWEELEHSDDGTPRVYVANASHALYPRSGTHDRPFPDPNDETGGDETVRPAVRLITETRPSWMRWDGRWGASRAGVVPGEQSSPGGPAYAGERWSDPARVHAGARSCLSAPGGLSWLWPALAAAAALIGMALVLRGRQRARSR